MTAAALPSGGPLAPLRDELALHPGPRGRDGSPTWTLHDPAAGRWFRIGWSEFEILARWGEGDPAAIAARVARETTLSPDADDVEEFARFLASSDLLRLPAPRGTERMLRQSATRRTDPLRWALKNYLFVRIPLVRPDRALAALLPVLGWLFTPWAALGALAVALLGAFLALRRWDEFAGTFLHFFSLEGAALAAASLLVSKIAHELGHGLVAKRHGCRVPTMGVAFMVLYPVLYTDTTDAWRLTERRRRLAIDVAGMGAELMLASAALLAWSLLPDGPLRSVAFVWATTTWILTLAVNLSPFMRFDGYYILSDLLDLPNLQDRSFALARWRIRELLFGFGDPPAEAWRPGMRRFLVAFAVATWAYRFLLFLGIALLVYHLFFKALGVLLFVVEIWWFIARPVARELAAWWRRRGEVRANRNTLATAAVAAALAAALLVPWRSMVEAPAVMAAERRATVFATSPGRVAEIAAEVGVRVEEGRVLVRLSSPDLDHRLAQARLREETLRWQAAALARDPEGAARGQLVWRELEAARAELAGLAEELSRLSAAAPFAGEVMELAPRLRPGDWVPAGEALAMVADTARTVVDAYAEEADLVRFAAGAAGTFVPDDPGLPTVPVRLARVADASSRTLEEPLLSSLHGGPVASRAGPRGEAVPVTPVYRLRFEPVGEPAGAAVPARETRGAVLVEAAPESPAARIWRRAVGVLVRESGF
jgi:putative peptide zinc metalloprotease protein